MKNIIFTLIILAFAANTAYSQMPPASMPDMELTEEQAEMRIKDWQARVSELQAKVDNESAEVESLKKQIEDAKKNLKDCQDALLALVGATNADIEKFRQALGVIEGKVRKMKTYSNDQLADMRDQVEALENELNELRKNKLSLLPEFYNRIISLAKDIRGLYREKKIKSYTVGTWSKDRDCLWNIAGKIDIYGDPFLWPKIWQANTDMIRNPDIIHPGQVLQLPPKGPKSSEEKKAERKYWRKKREMMEQQEDTGMAPSKGE